MGEITEKKDRREIYRALITDPQTAGTFKKYSFTEFESKLLSDEKAATTVGQRMVSKGLVPNMDSFFEQYINEPAPKPVAQQAPSRPVQVPPLLQPAQQGPSLTAVTGQQAVTPMAPEPQFQPFQFDSQAEIDQAAKSPVFLANPQAVEAQKGNIIMPTKEAEQDFNQLPADQQRAAIEGGTGGAYQAEQAEKKKSLFQKGLESATNFAGGFNRAIAKAPSDIVKTVDILSRKLWEPVLGKTGPSTLGQWAQKYEKWLDESDFAKEYIGDATDASLSGSVGSGLGQIATMISGGMGTKTIGGLLRNTIRKDVMEGFAKNPKLLDKVLSPESALAFAQVFNSEYEGMKAKGESDEVAFRQALGNSALAFPTENLPLANLFDRFYKSVGAPLAKRAMNALIQGAEEGSQEALQQVLSNVTNNQFAELETSLKDWSDGLQESSSAGSIVGLILGAISGVKGGRVKGQQPPTQLGGIATIPANPNDPNFQPDGQPTNTPVQPVVADTGTKNLAPTNQGVSGGTVDETTFVTVTPEELDAFKQGTVDPERANAIADDVDAVMKGELTLEAIEDPNYREMVKLKLAENQAAPAAQQGASQNVSLESKVKETENKIKNKNLFLAEVDENGNRVIDKQTGRQSQSVGEIISQSDDAPVPTSVREINGIEFVEFSNPRTGDVDVIVTGKNDGSYVGYYRLYNNGKPTNQWSSKFENPSRNKEDFKTMISGVQSMLPEGHEYTEKTSISTDGLRVWNQQLNRGYQLQYDGNGNLVTNKVAINGDAIVNELGIDVDKGSFENISVRNNADIKKVKQALLPYLQKLGLNESNLYFENGTVYIDLPVLKKPTNQAAATSQQSNETTTTTTPSPSLLGETTEATGQTGGGAGTDVQAVDEQGTDQIPVANETPLNPAPIPVATDETGGTTADVGTEPVAPESGGSEVEVEPVLAEEVAPAPAEEGVVAATTKPKVVDKAVVKGLLVEANDEYDKAKAAFDKKKAELNKTTREDTPDLFGKRKVEEGPQSLFEIPRISPQQRDKAIQPFRDRLDKAKKEINRLSKLLNEGQEITQKLKFESNEQVQTTDTEVREGKGATKDESVVRKKTPPVRNAGRTPDAIAARNIQFLGDPYYSSLQYVMDMTYHPDLLQSIFGGPDKNSKSGRKSIEGERKPRIQFLDKKSNIKTADRLGELLAEKYAEDNGISVKDAEEKHNFTDIAESIILNHSSRNQMVKAVLDQNDLVEDQHRFQYDPEGIYGEDFNEDAAKDVDNALENIPDSYWEGMDLTDDQYNELFAPEMGGKESSVEKTKQESTTNVNLQNEKSKGRSKQTGDGGGRSNSRTIKALEGAPSVRGFNGPDPRLVTVAENYAKENGIELKRQSEYVEVSEERGKRIAQAYEEMKHDPENPKVKEAFQNLIKQTKAQYQALVDAGYKFWFIDDSPNSVEYASSPYNAMRDLRENKEMGVFPTTAGYGSDASELDVADNPMLEKTKFMWPVGGLDGKMKPVLANDLFRAVHDAFGHGLEGAGFRARGEENAWQAHVRLFTGSAIGAITTETRGQNSWLNFGPKGDANRNAKIEDTVFADQKTGLMPEWTWTEGKAADMIESPFAAFDPPSESMSREQGRKARAALKEAVGAEQFKRMEAIHKNKEKVLEGLQSRKIIEVVCP